MAASIAVMVMLVVLDGVAWKIRDLTIDTPTRLEHVIRCLSSEKHIPPIVPAGSPLADSATAGSLRVVVEGNEVIVALVSTTEEGRRLIDYYARLGGSVPGRVERRDLVVYFWLNRASPTQRQTMYDCQY